MWHGQHRRWVRIVILGNIVPMFDFYEKVRVCTQSQKCSSVNGEIGAVTGRTQCDDGQWYYSVHIYASGISWCFYEHELTPTGEHAAHEDFYDGSSIRVRVDKDGRCSIVEDDDANLNDN